MHYPAAERIDGKLGKLEVLHAERYSDNGKTKYHPQEGMCKGYPYASAQEPQNIHQNVQAA